jgi:uncharacterized small protein (DUF1192 family)
MKFQLGGRKMSTVQTVSQTVDTLSVAELEKLIRRIVREEIALALDERDIYAGPTVIKPGSPIYEDLVELLRLKEEGKLKILSYEEAFGSDVLPSDGGETMSAVQTVSQTVNTLSVAELEELIRCIVREEIALAFDERDIYAEPTVIEPGSPLYEDLMDIERRAQEGRLKFYTYEEVFGK